MRPISGRRREVKPAGWRAFGDVRSRSTPAPSPMLSVYDRQTCVGFVLSRGPQGFEAFDADGKSRGFHKTQDKAAEAIRKGTPQ
jgi:hypothetical protein